MSSEKPKIKLDTALEMLGQYARLNDIPGQDLIAIFDAGRISAFMLNPALLGAGKPLVQRFDETSLEGNEQAARVAD